MDEAQVLKKEQDDQTKLYHKMLKGIEAMIDIWKQVQNIMKIAGEINITITKMEQTILQASINNQTMNTTNILGISENV